MKGLLSIESHVLSSDKNAHSTTANNLPGIILTVVAAMITYLCQTHFVGNMGKRWEGNGSWHSNDVLHATSNLVT